jgi:hypothetical protein
MYVVINQEYGVEVVHDIHNTHSAIDSVGATGSGIADSRPSPTLTSSLRSSSTDSTMSSNLPNSMSDAADKVRSGIDRMKSSGSGEAYANGE